MKKLEVFSKKMGGLIPLAVGTYGSNNIAIGPQIMLSDADSPDHGGWLAGGWNASRSGWTANGWSAGSSGWMAGGWNASKSGWTANGWSAGSSGWTASGWAAGK